ncbi:hypothetical protein Tco_0901998 [Tanacetum coccineum]
MAGSQDDIPPPPPPPPPSQTPTQQTPHTVSTIKLPILKKGEYDIWAMKMEHYLAHTDYPVWEVIQNGNGPVSISTNTQGQIKILPPKSAEEILARERERKARTTLLMALLEDHLARFHNISDAKEMWDAIKTRFGGNAWNSGNKDKENRRRSGKQEDSKALVTIDGEGVYWTSYSEEEEDYALMACNSLGSDTEVQSYSNECVASYNKLKKLYDEQRAQLSDASIEIKAYIQALKKVEAQLVAHQQGQPWYKEKIRFMKIDLDDKTDVLTYHKKLLAEAKKEKEDLKAKVEKWHNSSKNLSLLQNNQMSANDNFELGYGDHRYDGILSYENEVLQSVFMNKESDLENQPLYDSVEIPKIVSEPVVNEPNVGSQPKVWSDAPIIEEYESDSEDEHVSLPTKEQKIPSFAFINTDKHVKTPRQTVIEQNTCSQSPKPDKKDCSGLMSKKLGLGFGYTKKACFVCGSFSHLIRDCDFHEKRMAKQAELNNRMSKGSSQREIRPVWNNVQRMNHQNQFVPKAVLTRTGKILVNTARTSGTNNVSTARYNFNSQAVLTNADRKISTVKLFVNKLVLLGKIGKLLLRPQQVVIGEPKASLNGDEKDQTVLGKDYSNLLIADSLLKTIWFINAPCYGNEALASPKANELTIPEQTATGKGKSNPFMAAVLTRTGKIPVSTARASGTNNVSTARHNFNSQAVLTNAARKISTVKPFVNKVRPKTIFHKTHSPFRRPFNNTTALKTTFTKQKVNTAGVNSVSVIGQNRETVVKTSAGCNWRTKRHYWNRVSKYNSGSMTRTNVYFRDPQGRLKSAMAWVPKRN